MNTKTSSGGMFGPRRIGLQKCDAKMEKYGGRDEISMVIKLRASHLWVRCFVLGVTLQHGLGAVVGCRLLEG
jgi:hypothetical protein